MKKHWITIVVAVICAVVFFFIGRAAGVSSVSASVNKFTPSMRGSGAFARLGANGGASAGQIVSVDGSSLTIQMPNGNSENVYFSSSTQIVMVKPQTVSVSALTLGTQIIVAGTSNSDGSLTAQTIQIRTGTSTGAVFRGGNGG